MHHFQHPEHVCDFLGLAGEPSETVAKFLRQELKEKKTMAQLFLLPGNRRTPLKSPSCPSWKKS